MWKGCVNGKAIVCERRYWLGGFGDECGFFKSWFLFGVRGVGCMLRKYIVDGCLNVWDFVM